MDAVIRATPQLRGRLVVAGSKNYTARYVLATALAAGESTVINPAPIDDGLAMAECCEALGAQIDRSDASHWRVVGTGGRLNAPLRLNVRNAGAVARFLIAVCATSPEPIEIYTPYPQSLGKRPQADLLDALTRMGAEVEAKDGKLPVTVRRGHLQAQPVTVSGKTSSQYLTGLLFLAPLLSGTTEIRIPDALRSKPLIRQTLAVLADVGIDVVASPDLMSYRVEGPQPYRAGRYAVPGDWPSAAALLCAGAVTASDITLEGLFADSQGERSVLDVLQRMGATIEFDAANASVRLRSDGRLRPVEFDGDLATDAVLSMVAAAAFAAGTSRFHNVENLRYKESDRITDFCRELRKAGVNVEETRSEIIVHGNPEPVPGGVEIDAHLDHRILMALTIVGLRSEQPLVLHEIEHVAKSYPRYFIDVAHLGANVTYDAAYVRDIASVGQQ